MIDKIISYSVYQRLTVFAVSALVAVLGVWSLFTMKVDILPDINKPTITVFAEAKGMAAEEVERLILYPLEAAIAGAPGMERMRGTASFGIATINAEFKWGSDIYRNRQLLQERISRVPLLDGVVVSIGPPGSIMGEVMWVGLTSPGGVASPMELRTFADFSVRQALLKVPGVADVLVMGGDVREWQVNINAQQLQNQGLSIQDIHTALASALTNKSGGFLIEDGMEYPIRIITAPASVLDLQDVAIGRNSSGRVIRLADVARIVEGASPVRGTASIDGEPGVIMRVVRQPDAETLSVTKAVDEAMATLRQGLPSGMELKTDLFRQEEFITAGLTNVEWALRDASILVVIVLAVFLMNMRATMITAVSLLLSILVTAIVFKMLGLSVNVMTLGGIAVAVGELVDDSIVDIENVLRRLRSRIAGSKITREETVVSGSSEVRNSIVYATALVAVVFLPVFFIPGVEGKLIASLGAAYLIALIASLVVAITVTPALSAALFTEKSLANHKNETRFAAAIKLWLQPKFKSAIIRVRMLGWIVVATLVSVVTLYAFAGKEGIPPFNEGSATVLITMPIGTDVNTTNDYSRLVATAIQEIPGVRQVSGITGRSAADPHAFGSNQTEMQVLFDVGLESETERLFGELQLVLDGFNKARFSIGQPITHRIEELLSGVRAPIVIKVFGDNPAKMKQAADKVVAALAAEEGVTNAQIQQDSFVSELRINLDYARLALSSLSPSMVATELEMGLMGDAAGQVRLGTAVVDVVPRFDAESRGSIVALRDLALPFENAPSLGSVGEMTLSGGINRVSHEAGRRVLVVSANYQGRDIVGAVENARSALMAQKLPEGTSLSFEGTYKSQKESSRRIAISFVFAMVLIFAILRYGFSSNILALIVMASIPTAFIGGMIGVWLTGGTINLAHLIGFVSLAGIVSRTGIMLIGRSIALARRDGKVTVENVVEATLDRVTPVLMTATVTALALLPFILFGDKPGKEFLNPLAVVMFGGLISSTIISLFFVPALFYRFGARDALSAKTQVTSF